jgi:GAF domain-containing protein/methyl-accepting chemotaxis protein
VDSVPKQGASVNLESSPVRNKQQNRNAYLICMASLLVFSSMAFLYVIVSFQVAVWQMYVLTVLMLLLAIASGIGMWFVNNDRIDLGIGLVVTSVIIVLPLTSLLTQGLGVYLGIAQLAGITLVLALTLPKRLGIVLGILNLISAGLTIYLDLTGGQDRIEFPIIQTVVAVVVAAGLVVFFVILFREFRNFSLQAKITLGILFTSGVALSALSFFALNRTTDIITSLSSDLETVSELRAEEQLISTVTDAADQANRSLDATVSQVVNLASQLDLYHEEENTFGNGAYWNAEERMAQMGEGQYSNSQFDTSSVFVPSTKTLEDTLVRDLNTNIYLDFSAPFVLENNQQIESVYFTDLNGAIIYYPNIQLASVLPHDYDGTAQPSFRIATPLFNAGGEPRWSFPRQDPAGTGLIVSVSTPVYFNEEFIGVMAADFRLEEIANNINSIQVGETGYAFLIDSDGHIIAMPPEGYEFFGLEPEELEMNEEPQQTVFDGRDTFELQQVTNRMVVGGSGVLTTNIDGVDTFIAFAPLANNSFSLGVIVPVEEMTKAVQATQEKIATQIELALRNATIILIILLVVAVFVSLGLGQVIASPVLRLTQTANQILGGDISAQAEVTSTDEIGTLAQAFNAMTGQLRQTLTGLEKTVEERTTELVAASENNVRRARQFQSIAQVARTVSSTLDFDSLLTQITTVISREFGFYHVGVFLLDLTKEYAVLSATNSEGGQLMLARGHRLKVGEKGLVGFVSSTGRPRVALDTGADAVFFNNPDLPNTRSEIALPLRAGQDIIGVLDVQSTEPNAFSQEDVAILTTLADQVSIAIQNARQNEETKRALAEADALSKQFVQTGWNQFTKRQNLLGVRHSGAKTSLIYAKNGRGENVHPANQPRSKGRGAVLSIPIKLRGQVIGSVDVRAPDNRQWDQDELDIVTAIIERAAIAMENARLLAESQKRAAKERTIGEISAKISAKSDIEELIKTAARELTQTLPGTEIAIQFRKEATE